MIQKFDFQKIPPVYAVEDKNKFELLNTTERQADELWEEIKITITKVAQEYITYKKPMKLARWISEATIETAKDRRKAKAVGDSEIMQRLNAKFQTEARKDNEKYWADQCKKLEEATLRRRPETPLWQERLWSEEVMTNKQSEKDGRNM